MSLNGFGSSSLVRSRIPKMKITSILAAVALTVSSGLSAQNYLRDRAGAQFTLSLESHSQYPELRIANGTLLIARSSGGVVKAQAWTRDDPPVLQSSITLPVDWVGGVQEVGVGEILVSGTSVSGNNNSKPVCSCTFSMW